MGEDDVSIRASGELDLGGVRDDVDLRGDDVADDVGVHSEDGLDTGVGAKIIRP